MGSPAQPLYTLELLYLPPAWVSTNASQLISNNPIGTGENDYAFLRITGTVSPSVPLPASFPALAPYVGDADTGESTLLVAYPAGFLDGATIEMNLFVSSAFTTVKKLFSFDDAPNVDLISIGGTIVSQSGSSGGAVVRTQDGALIGIIATATVADTTAERDLRAITMGHINRSLAHAGKGSIAELLLGDLGMKAADFRATVAPGEQQKLLDVLNNR
jgi:hypothetical protein